MLTAQATLDALTRYDITPDNLSEWEKALGLEIPQDATGRKIYSPHHINLFKNVKKHLALGRTLSQIRSIISLPPASDAVQISTPPIAETAVLTSKDPGARKQEREQNPLPPNVNAKAETPIIKERPPKSPYAATPQRPAPRSGSGATEVVELVKRLTAEKDHLYQKLLETEKLNSHLYSANNLYHRRVKDLEQSMDSLRNAMPFDQNVKLMDDKAKLHRQVLDSEKKLNEREFELKNTKQAVLELNQNMQKLNQRLHEANQPFDASIFCGDWMESGRLIEIVYDNFGINVEPERVRLFRVSKAPERFFGNTAVITTNYQYETNPQWRRQETLVASYMVDQTLEGEVTAEYILDGVPVAKAVYRVQCKRNA